MKRHFAVFYRCFMLIGVAAGLTACSTEELEPEVVLRSEGMGQVSTSWRRSELLYNPVVVASDEMWEAVQNRIGRQMRDFDFSQYIVVGGFAIEPDMPEKNPETGQLKDRGYGVWIKSVKWDSHDNKLIVRMKVKQANFPKTASGPLHYAFAAVRSAGLKPDNTVFYVNGVEHQFELQQSFVQQRSTTQMLKDTYGK